MGVLSGSRSDARKVLWSDEVGRRLRSNLDYISFLHFIPSPSFHSYSSERSTQTRIEVRFQPSHSLLSGTREAKGEEEGKSCAPRLTLVTSNNVRHSWFPIFVQTFLSIINISIIFHINHHFVNLLKFTRSYPLSFVIEWMEKGKD